MQIKITGKNIDLGDTLRDRIAEGLEAAVTKYFDRPSEGHVSVSKEAHLVLVDCNVHLPSGIVLQAQGRAADPYAALEDALTKMEKRVRRYKRRLKDHHRPDRAPLPSEPAQAFILQGAGEDEPDEDSLNGADAPLIVAETAMEIKTMSVSEAVMQLELGENPAIMFRSAGHGGLNVVFKRSDGHIGWIDPASRQSKT